MEIRIEIDELKKRKLFVATPMYGGQCHGMYTRTVSYTHLTLPTNREV